MSKRKKAKLRVFINTLPDIMFTRTFSRRVTDLHRQYFEYVTPVNVVMHASFSTRRPTSLFRSACRPRVTATRDLVAYNTNIPDPKFQQSQLDVGRDGTICKFKREGNINRNGLYSVANAFSAVLKYRKHVNADWPYLITVANVVLSGKLNVAVRKHQFSSDYSCKSGYKFPGTALRFPTHVSTPSYFETRAINLPGVGDAISAIQTLDKVIGKFHSG